MIARETSSNRFKNCW